MERVQMPLNDLMVAVRKFWWIVVLLPCLGALAGFAAYTATPKTYTSETELFVNTRSAGTVAELQQGEVFAQSRAQSYVAVAPSPLVLDPVIKKLNLSDSAVSLANRMAAIVKPGTVVIRISVSDKDPQTAEKLANEINTSLRTVAASLEKMDGAASSPIQLLTLTGYTPATKPTAPNLTMNVALGAFVGLFAGLGTAVVLERRRHKTEPQIKTTLGAQSAAGVRTSPGTKPPTSGAAKRPPVARKK